MGSRAKSIVDVSLSRTHEMTQGERGVTIFAFDEETGGDVLPEEAEVTAKMVGETISKIVYLSDVVVQCGVNNGLAVFVKNQIPSSPESEGVILKSPNDGCKSRNN
jgi:hypothetical protein